MKLYGKILVYFDSWLADKAILRLNQQKLLTLGLGTPSQA